MRIRAVGFALFVSLAGCGGRTQPLLGELESEVGGSPAAKTANTSKGSFGGHASKGGSGGAGGVPLVGGSLSKGGTTSFSSTATSTSKDLTVTLPGPVRWFAARTGDKTLSLIGVDANYQVSVTVLPGASQGSQVLFSPKGSKFAYSVGPYGNEVGFGTLTSTTASIQVKQVARDGVQLMGWLNETLFAMNLSENSDSYVVVSTDPNEEIPTGVPAVPLTSSFSPNGKFVQSEVYPQRSWFRVTDKRFQGEEVLAEEAAWGATLWNATSNRFLSAHSLDSEASPVLDLYDIPVTSGPATRVPLPANMAVGHLYSCNLSSDGRYLSKWREESSGGFPSITDVADLSTGKTAVITNAIDPSVAWIGNVLVANDANNYGSLLAARITPEAVESGTITLAPLTAQYGTVTKVTHRQSLTDDTLLLVRQTTDTTSVLQTLTETTSGLVTENILPGTAGDSSLGTLVNADTQTSMVWLPPEDRHVQFVAAAAPSYYLLDFNQGKLFRSVRLRDYLGEDENYGMTDLVPVPELPGLIARSKTKKTYSWLYLEGPSKGRLIGLPLPDASSNVAWFFPPTWPSQ